MTVLPGTVEDPENIKAPRNPADAVADAVVGAASRIIPMVAPPAQDPAVKDPAVLDPAVKDPAVLDPAVKDPAVKDPAVLDPAVLDPGEGDLAVEDMVPGQVYDIPDAESDDEEPVSGAESAPEIINIPDDEYNESLSPELRDPSPGVGTRLKHAVFGDGIEDELALSRGFLTASGSVIGSTLMANRLKVFGVQLGMRVPVIPGPAGFFVNPITGTLVGGSLGSFIGTYLPEATASSLEFVLGDVFGMDEFKNFRADTLFLTPAQIKYKAENESLFDLATGGGFTLIKFGMRGVGRIATAAGREEARILAEKGAKFGIDLTPIQVGDRAIGATFFNVMGRFPWLGAGPSKLILKSIDGLKEQLSKVGTRLGPLMSDADISVRIFNDARDLMIDTNLYFKKRYTAVFERAAKAGVVVVPNRLIAMGNEILKELDSKAIVRLADDKKIDGAVMAKVRTFIEDNVGVLSEPTKAGIEGFPKMFVKELELARMDGFLSSADEMLATLSAAEKDYAFTLINRLKTAALTDMASEGSVIGRGVIIEDGKEIIVTAVSIVASMRALDQEFSYFMSEVFESTVANQLGRVVKGGTKRIKSSGEQVAAEVVQDPIARGGAPAVFQQTKRTQVQIDQLGATLLKLDSPASVDQLFKLVGEDTFRAVTTKALDDAVTKAMKGTTIEGAGSHFSADKFAKALGLTGKADSRAQSLEKLLKHSGHPWSVKDFEDLIEVARAVEKVEIPGVATFLARKAIIGGIKGAITGMLPGIALAGAGKGVLGWVGAGLGMGMFIGGNKFVMKMISNPRAARAWKDVANAEASDVARRMAYVRVFKEVIQTIPDVEWAKESKQAALQAVEISAQAYQNLLDSMK